MERKIDIFSMVHDIKRTLSNTPMPLGMVDNLLRAYVTELSSLTFEGSSTSKIKSKSKQKVKDEEDVIKSLFDQEVNNGGSFINDDEWIEKCPNRMERFNNIQESENSNFNGFDKLTLGGIGHYDKGISLDLQGDIVFLSGDVGKGKSTILRSIQAALSDNVPSNLFSFNQPKHRGFINLEQNNEAVNTQSWASKSLLRMEDIELSAITKNTIIREVSHKDDYLIYSTTKTFVDKVKKAVTCRRHAAGLELEVIDGMLSKLKEMRLKEAYKDHLTSEVHTVLSEVMQLIYRCVTSDTLDNLPSKDELKKKLNLTWDFEASPNKIVIDLMQLLLRDDEHGHVYTTYDLWLDSLISDMENVNTTIEKMSETHPPIKNVVSFLEGIYPSSVKALHALLDTIVMTDMKASNDAARLTKVISSLVKYGLVLNELKCIEEFKEQDAVSQYITEHEYDLKKRFICLTSLGQIDCTYLEHGAELLFKKFDRAYTSLYNIWYEFLPDKICRAYNIIMFGDSDSTIKNISILNDKLAMVLDESGESIDIIVSNLSKGQKHMLSLIFKMYTLPKTVLQSCILLDDVFDSVDIKYMVRFIDYFRDTFSMKMLIATHKSPQELEEGFSKYSSKQHDINVVSL